MANSLENVVVLAPTGGNEAQKLCSTCGNAINIRAEICPGCGVRQRTPVSKAGLLLLTFFLGGLGVHKFYLGKYWQGALYLIFCWTYIPALLALVEFIIYVFTSSDRLNEKYIVKGSAIAVFVVAAIVILFIIGILAAIAFPAYQHYTKRAKVSEALTIHGSLKTKIAEAFINTAIKHRTVQIYMMDGKIFINL